MLFVLFSLLYFINYSCASSHSDGKDESLSFPPKVPSEILAVYELEKNNIISFLRSEFKNKDRFSITNENRTKLGSAMKNLCNLDVKGLLEAMINESGYFLMTFWFLNQREFVGIDFFRTNTLYSLELPVTFMNSRNVGRIFKNFKDFIIQASVNTCSLSQSDGEDLLCIFRMFWHQKIVPLGIKVFNKRQLKIELKSIEKLFRFLSRFFNNDPKAQIIWEYKRLQQDIQSNSHNFALKSFSFLSRHLEYRLRTLPDSSEFLDDLAWLASQSQLFLIYFFYVLDYQDRNGVTPPLWHLRRHKKGRFDLMGRIPCNSIIILDDKAFFIFSNRTYSNKEQTEAVELARVILSKLGIKNRPP